MDLCVVHGELRHGGEIDFVGRRNVLDAGREDDRAVELLMSVFMMTVVRQVVILASPVVLPMMRKDLQLRKMPPVHPFSSFATTLLHEAKRWAPVAAGSGSAADAVRRRLQAFDTY